MEKWKMEKWKMGKWKGGIMEKWGYGILLSGDFDKIVFKKCYFHSFI